MRRAIVFIAAVAIVLAAAGSAWAHEEITPKTFPTGQPTFFTLTAANEQKADLTKVTLAAPAQAPFGGTTHEPAGWTVNRTDKVITWTGGAVKPDTFEQWGYEIDSADQPGVLHYKVTLGFADGKSDDVNVDITAVAPGGTTTASSGSAVTAAPATNATIAPATEAPAKSDDGGGKANAALGLGGAALLLSVIATALAVRKRGDAPASAGGSPAAGQKQDW
jgi:hypothetical protein